jgi:phosphoribosylformimino-5-aminoimidazole carboxamide ribotide isomerase
MRVIPVLDLRVGRAVHARGGARAEYRSVRSRLTPRDGDALALARAFRGTLGLDELYVADLDAIDGGEMQRALLGVLAREAHTWVDAGVRDAERAARLLASGAARVIVGLETLPDLEALAAIVERVGRERVAFSLDLRDGAPVAASPALAALEPVAIIARAADAGVAAAIVLDLAHVGRGAGADVSLVRAIHRAAPRLELIAGGGVRGRADLDALAVAGARGALVATALHDGALSREDVTGGPAPERRAADR